MFLFRDKSVERIFLPLELGGGKIELSEEEGSRPEQKPTGSRVEQRAFQKAEALA